MAVEGVGIYNDGLFKCCVNGKKTREYQLWHGMFTRCYNEKFLKRSPWYLGCEVAEEWHYFQNFASWCQEQIGFNSFSKESSIRFELDKDLISGGNRIYSPNTCVFIPQELNVLLLNKPNTNGYPQGVSWSNTRKNM